MTTKTLTTVCPHCHGHSVIEEPCFGGMVPCPACTGLSAGVDPYPGGDAFEACGSYFDDDTSDEYDGVLDPRD
jgi:hypothetical protein